MKFVFLGTGASSGVPVAGCQCDVCLSSDRKNKRLRTSGLLFNQEKNLLIDASPDIRMIALQRGMRHVTALFITHPHEDHIGGLNDLRSFTFLHNKTIPMFLSEETLKVVTVRSGYLLERFAVQTIGDRGVIEIEGIKLSYFTYAQRGMPVTGFRYKNFSYVTDIKEYDPSIFEWLRGTKQLVLGMIHEEESRMHFSLQEAIAFAKQVGAEQCYLTHMSHNVEHETISQKLPKGIALAYDGLEIDVG